MPRLKEIRSEVQAAGPMDIPNARPGFTDEGVQSIAKGLENFADAIEKRKSQAETADISAKLAKFQADSTNQWHETLRKADPSDAELSQKFMDNLDQNLQKLGEGLESQSARNYFTREAAQLKGHFSVSTVTGQAELAGKKAVADHEQFIGNLSASTLTDPSSFEFTRARYESGLQAMVDSGQLPSAAAQALKQKGERELAQASVRGWIKLSAKEGRDQLQKGLWDKYIDGDMKKQLFLEADQQERADLTETERLRRESERVAEEARKNTQNDFLAKMEKGQLSTRDVLNSNLEAFGSGSKDQFIRMLSQEGRDPTAKTDPGLYISLWDKIHLPDTDPKKLRDENELNQYMGRGLSVTSLRQLRDEIAGKRTAEGNIESQLKENFLTIAKNQFTKSNPLLGIRDPEGDEIYQSFLSTFINEYKTKRGEGKAAKDLLDPKSKEYLGYLRTTFTKTPQQIINTMVKTMAPPKGQSAEAAPGPSPSPSASPSAKPARLPNESPAAYLKRIKGE